ncbi:MAG: hypothetical protein OHK0029_36550 [Armatimonadaceae bacterium]
MPRFKQQVLVEFEIEALDQRDANRRADMAVEKIPVALIKGGFNATVPGDVEVKLWDQQAQSAPPAKPAIPAYTPPPAPEPVRAPEPTPEVVPAYAAANREARIAYGNGGPGEYLAADANGGQYRNTLTTHTSAVAAPSVRSEADEAMRERTALEEAAPDLYAACEKVAESCAIVLRSIPLPSALSDHLRLVEKITRSAVEKANAAETRRDLTPARR